MSTINPNRNKFQPKPLDLFHSLDLNEKLNVIYGKCVTLKTVIKIAFIKQLILFTATQYECLRRLSKLEVEVKNQIGNSVTVASRNNGNNLQLRKYFPINSFAQMDLLENDLRDDKNWKFVVSIE